MSPDKYFERAVSYLLKFLYDFNSIEYWKIGYRVDEFLNFGQRGW
jgi:hypothetical protein